MDSDAYTTASALSAVLSRHGIAHAIVDPLQTIEEVITSYQLQPFAAGTVRMRAKTIEEAEELAKVLANASK